MLSGFFWFLEVHIAYPGAKMSINVELPCTEGQLN